jgi:DNA polymerase I
MKLTRICSEFDFGNWNIHKFGTEDGEEKHYIESFRDYFYFKADEIHRLDPFTKVTLADATIYKSLYGDDCRKISYTSIKERNAIRDAFPDSTYELDVMPEFKYLMNNPMEWSEQSDRHILCYDIETWTDENRFAPPEDPFAQVTSIQLHSSKLDKYVTITWHPEHTGHLTEPNITESDGVVYIFCPDEMYVLESFITFVVDYNVDVLTGWFSAQYDLPYIIERCKMLNIDYTKLSPVGKIANYQKMEMGKMVWRTFITGLDHVDMMIAISDKLNYKFANNKLDTAAKEVLGEDDRKLTEYTWKDWPDHFEEFIKYGIRDVVILKKLDDKLGVFQLYCYIQAMANLTQLSDINSNTMVVDKYIMTEFNGEVIFPTSKSNEKIKYMGAHVMVPDPGLSKNVGVVDYASLYPTTIMSFNLSPETFICSDETAKPNNFTLNEMTGRMDELGMGYIDTGECDELVGGRYLFKAQSSKIGVLPRSLKKLYAERVAVKSKMKKLDGDSDEYNALDKHQYAIKIILNSAYGALGFPFFRLYKTEVADAITFFARKALMHVIDSLNENGNTVLYGDTDSAFFSQNGDSDDVINKWVDDFNSGLSDSFIPKYNNGVIDEYKMMALEYEKSLELIYFGPSSKNKKVGSKKRYYSIIKGSGKKYIKGLNIIRKDAPNFLKTKLDEMSEHCVRETLTTEMLHEVRAELETLDYREIGIPKKYGMAFGAYKVKAAHLKGALFSNEHLGTTINHNDVPFMFFIKSNCEDVLPKGKRSVVICLNEEDLHFIGNKNEIFELDYDLFYKKQVVDQLTEFVHIEYVDDVLKQYKKEIK